MSDMQTNAPAAEQEECQNEMGLPLPLKATGFRERKPKREPRMSKTIPGMTIGRVRKCLNQIREGGDAIVPNSILHTGHPAGLFALQLVKGMYANRKASQERKKQRAEARRMPAELDNLSEGNSDDDY